MEHPSVNPNRSVKIAGAATVAQAAAIRDQFAAAVLDRADVAIEIEATEVDVTVIQLLIAARRSMQARGGTLRLSRPPSGPLLQALTDGGFIHHGAEDAIWTTGVSR